MQNDLQSSATAVLSAQNQILNRAYAVEDKFQCQYPLSNAPATGGTSSFVGESSAHQKISRSQFLESLDERGKQWQHIVDTMQSRRLIKPFGRFGIFLIMALALVVLAVMIAPKTMLLFAPLIPLGVLPAMKRHQKIIPLLIIILAFSFSDVPSLLGALIAGAATFILSNGLVIMSGNIKRKHSRFEFVEHDHNSVIVKHCTGYNFNPILVTLLPKEIHGIVKLLRPSPSRYKSMVEPGDILNEDFVVPQITIGNHAYIVMERRSQGIEHGTGIRDRPWNCFNDENEMLNEIRSHAQWVERLANDPRAPSNPVPVTFIQIGYNNAYHGGAREKCCETCNILVPSHGISRITVGTVACALRFLQERANENRPMAFQRTWYLATTLTDDIAHDRG